MAKALTTKRRRKPKLTYSKARCTGRTLSLRAMQEVQYEPSLIILFTWELYMTPAEAQAVAAQN